VKLNIATGVIATGVLAAGLLASGFAAAGAGEAATSAPCDDFKKAAASGASPQGASGASFEARFRRQTEVGQKGLECARRLTERFKSLRAASDPALAEKVLDEYTEVYKKLLDGIEGDGMLLEEANLVLNVIAARIKEAESRSPGAVKAEEARKQRLGEQIETIVKFKTALDRQLVDIITKKKDISFYVRGRQIDEAIEMFGKFNEGLSQSVNEMNRNLQTPPEVQATGGF
jgi:hypothetical protein